MSRPDPFALLLGAYVGALAVTLLVAVVGAAPTGTVTLATGLAVFLTVTLWADSHESLAVTMARTQSHLALLCVSAVGLVGWMVVYDTMPAQRQSILPWLPFLAVSGVIGMGVYLLANRRVLAWAREHDAVLAEWTAEPTARHKWGLRAFSIVGAIALLSAGLYYEDALFLARFAPTASGVLFAFSLLAGRKRRYVALSDGLYVTDSGSLAGQYIPWSRFTGYAVTDRTLALYRWIPLLAFRSDREDIPDVDALTAILDGYLTRRDSQ